MKIIKPLGVENLERTESSVYITFRDDPDTKNRMGILEARHLAKQILKLTEDKGVQSYPVPPFSLGEK